MAETPAEPVFRLIYRSHNRIPEVDRKAELGEIFSASRSGNKSKSDELKGQLEALYASRRAEIDAFRNQPVERVMERLGERLKGSTIEIQPYRNDGSPQRVQLENVGGAP